MCPLTRDFSITRQVPGIRCLFFLVLCVTDLSFMCALIFDFLFNGLVAFVSQPNRLINLHYWEIVSIYFHYICFANFRGGRTSRTPPLNPPLVPYITERRPCMSTHPFFLLVTSVMNLPKCVLSPEINKAGLAHSSGAPEITPGF
jgi:hypothetical protein